MPLTARQWLQAIWALAPSGRFRIMNVCGGHERAISMAGIRSLLPEYIELIPGPGCPVCVCPEEDTFTAMHYALEQDLILLAFGDMLRVPVNVKKGQPRSLEQARTEGADIRAIASPMEAVSLARDNPGRAVVFFAAGFETTMAPVAAMVQEGLPDNLFLLLSGRLTWPVVAMLLSARDERDGPAFDALIAPGHVAATMGPQQWQFVVEDHGLPVAVAGFESQSLLAAFYSVLRQKQQKRIFLDNCYPRVVLPEGNPGARQCLEASFEIIDSPWRGIGTIKASGYALKAQYQAHDVRRQFPAPKDGLRQRAGDMPAGCDCARVVLGQRSPDQCRLYGRACTPRQPVGPCMVSDEGACRIWWASGIRESAISPGGRVQGFAKPG